MMRHLASRLRCAARGIVHACDGSTYDRRNVPHAVAEQPKFPLSGSVYHLNRLCKGTLQFIAPTPLCGFQTCIFRSVVGTHARSPSVALDIVGVRSNRMGVFLN